MDKCSLGFMEPSLIAETAPLGFTGVKRPESEGRSGIGLSADVPFVALYGQQGFRFHSISSKHRRTQERRLRRRLTPRGQAASGSARTAHEALPTDDFRYDRGRSDRHEQQRPADRHHLRHRRRHTFDRRPARAHLGDRRARSTGRDEASRPSLPSPTNPRRGRRVMRVRPTGKPSDATPAGARLPFPAPQLRQDRDELHLAAIGRGPGTADHPRRICGGLARLQRRILPVPAAGSPAPTGGPMGVPAPADGRFGGR